MQIPFGDEVEAAATRALPMLGRHADLGEACREHRVGLCHASQRLRLVGAEHDHHRGAPARR